MSKPYDRPVTTYSLSKQAPNRAAADALVVGVVSSPDGPTPAPGAEVIAETYGRDFRAVVKKLDISGAPGTVAKLPAAGYVKAGLVLFVGLGDNPDDPEAVRRAAGVAARSLGAIDTVALALPASTPELIKAAAEGFELGGYSFSTYKTIDEPERPASVIVLTELARLSGATKALAAAEALAIARNRTRDWVNTPPGDFTPATFAEAVIATNRKRRGGRIAIRVWDEKQLLAQGFGGIVGVGQGSDNPPRLVQLTYKPIGTQKPKAKLAFVGKGITFDSGGLSIKPAGSMAWMKSDMAGAAAVVNAIFTIADLGLPVQITAFAPMAENMINGHATRPGDVLNMYGGKTVEVLNTDAEGRLVLADALALAVKGRPDAIVDVATLTGACVQALGDRIAGLMGNDQSLIERVAAAGAAAGEPSWHLPIPDEMGEKVRGNSKIADLAQHNSERWGGALYAAAFLREFVGKVPWAHLDIAGPSYNEKGPYGYTPTAATGTTVATLVELAASFAD